ncbi:acylphosphatase-2-like, partial [Daktulosphaira vitifoliae]|uniref:acylphosphatase-2-like n=1 Tax=Daktulosphaira vitifoliae TaxID=58002 RepID=UPI0021AA9D93
MALELLSVDFEIFGTVQKVSFRKYTREQGKLLGLRGWCKNTPVGTVIGTIEGPPKQIDKMKNWLQTVGSPASRIVKAEFKNEKSLNDYKYNTFT